MSSLKDKSKMLLREHAKDLTLKFIQLRTQALQRGLTDKDLAETFRGASQKDSLGVKKTRSRSVGKRVHAILINPVFCVPFVVLIGAVGVGLSLATCKLFTEWIRESPCIVEYNRVWSYMTHPLMDCDACRGLTHVPEERNISAKEFYMKYAYSARPVLVKEATVNWTAMSVFSFQYFRQLYTQMEGALQAVEKECHFFPYLTEFTTLAEVFNMSDERASFQPGEKPWYIGWSNCYDATEKELRTHYRKPYFLPEDSDSIKNLDWIFMGGSGPGARIHMSLTGCYYVDFFTGMGGCLVDLVPMPSWQAQISGRKSWLLIPPPECENVCQQLNVTMEKGDIIVVDTAIWYHSTFVHPGEVSISIGSEYD